MKAKAFKFKVDFKTLTPAEKKAVLAADAQLNKVKDGTLGALFAQVWVSKGVQLLEINGCFLEPKYVDRIEAILDERKKAMWKK